MIPRARENSEVVIIYPDICINAYIYTLWLFNIAMENPKHKWKIIYGSMGFSMGHYINHNNKWIFPLGSSIPWYLLQTDDTQNRRNRHLRVFRRILQILGSLGETRERKGSKRTAETPDIWIIDFKIIGLVWGKIYRKPCFLPSNIGLSCKFSHHPILCLKKHGNYIDQYGYIDYHIVIW